MMMMMMKTIMFVGLMTDRQTDMHYVSDIDSMFDQRLINL